MIIACGDLSWAARNPLISHTFVLKSGHRISVLFYFGFISCDCGCLFITLLVLAQREAARVNHGYLPFLE